MVGGICDYSTSKIRHQVPQGMPNVPSAQRGLEGDDGDIRAIKAEGSPEWVKTRVGSALLG